MAAVKRTVPEQNAGVSPQFQVFKTLVRDSLLRERLMYGVISYMVARRRNEIGIRIALGANRNNVAGGSPGADGGLT